jgi:hypothetical protein
MKSRRSPRHADAPTPNPGRVLSATRRPIDNNNIRRKKYSLRSNNLSVAPHRTVSITPQQSFE